MSETFTLQTTLGPLNIQFTDAKHAYISTGRDNAVTVNRVQYSVGCHVYLWSDGAWRIGQEQDEIYLQRQSFHMTRANWFKYKDAHPSKSAWDKAAGEIGLAAHNFAVNNPAVIRDAHREHLREVAEKLEREYTEALLAADEARKQFDLARAAWIRAALGAP